MRNVIGPPAAGVDFFERPEIVGRLVDDLTDGRGSRRMFGLRRIGKSSISLEVQRQLSSQQDITVALLDVQGLTRFDGFLAALLRELPDREDLALNRAKIFGQPWVKKLFAATTAVVTKEVPEPQRDFVNEFAHTQLWAGDIGALLTKIQPLVLIVDELPFMLRNMLEHGYQKADIEQFMAQLRFWRHKCGVRMLMTGSLGFGQLQRDHAINLGDSIGDLVPISVPPLSREDAISMTNRLVEGEKLRDWTREHSEALVDGVAETWPVFIQAALDEVRRTGERDLSALRQGPSAEARRALDETFYSQYQTRLQRYQALRPITQQVLRGLSHAPDTRLSFDEILALVGGHAEDTAEVRDTVLTALEEDDFVVLDTAGREVQLANRLVATFIASRPWGA